MDTPANKPLWLTIAYSLLHGVLPTGVGIAFRLFMSSETITADWPTIILYVFVALVSMATVVKLVYWMVAHDTQVVTFIFTCAVCYMIVSTCNASETRCVEGYQAVSGKLKQLIK